MSNTIYQHKRTTTPNAVPTTDDISTGQIAINLVDNRAFTSNGTATFDLISNVAGTFHIANTTANGVWIGNSTVNAVINNTSFKISNSTSNALISIPTAAQWGGNYVLHANGSWINSASWGKQSIWVPAAALTARTTAGTTYATYETSTNKTNYTCMEFSASANSYAQFGMRMPKSWDEGTITASFVWSHPSTTTNFGTVFGLEAVGVRDGVAIDTAYGTAQTIADTGGSTDTIYITSETPAITIAGTPQAQDYVYFQVKRLPADASDTLAVVARLHGINLFITTDAVSDT